MVSGRNRSVALGASRCSRSSSGGTSKAAVASAMAMTKVSRVRCGSKDLGEMTPRSALSAVRTSGQMASAKGVGSTPRPARISSSSPKASRSLRRALLAAGWVIARLRAAREMLRSAMTSSKTRSRFRSKFWKSTLLPQ